MPCHSGGSVEIYLDPILPASRLVVFGVSPIARALVRLGQAMGYAGFAGGTAPTAPQPGPFAQAGRVLPGTGPAPPGPATPQRGGGFAGGGRKGVGGEGAL